MPQKLFTFLLLALLTVSLQCIFIQVTSESKPEAQVEAALSAPTRMVSVSYVKNLHLLKERTKEDESVDSMEESVVMLIAIVAIIIGGFVVILYRMSNRK